MIKPKLKECNCKYLDRLCCWVSQLWLLCIQPIISIDIRDMSMSSTEDKVYWACTRDQHKYLHSNLVFIRYSYRIFGISLLSILLTLVMIFYLTICIINHITIIIIIIIISTIIIIIIIITNTNHFIIIIIIITTTTTTTSIIIITVITFTINIIIIIIIIIIIVIIIIIILSCRCRLFSTNPLSELLLDHI